MAVKISEISVHPSVVNVGETFTVTITAVDVTWEVIKNEFETWNDIKTDFTNWRSVLNYN